MRDKLIELLKTPMCVEGDCENCEGLENGALCNKVHYGKQADHLIANGVTVQRWIPVSESLPERAMSLAGKRTCIDSDEVLVYVGRYSQVLVAKYWHDEAVWEEAFQDLTVYGVTHWMPLPEPPKEGE